MKQPEWQSIQTWYDEGTHSLYRDVKAKFGVSRNQIEKALDEGLLIAKTQARRVKDSCAKKFANGTLYATDEQRETQRKAMRAAVLRNPASYSSNSVCGRAKIYSYNGVKLKGSWELNIAQLLDSENICWEREVAPIEYYFDGSNRHYFPDFWLPDLKVFIEVKGYATARDFAKWEAARKISTLVVIQKEDYKTLTSKKISLKEYLKRAAGWLSEEVS